MTLVILAAGMGSRYGGLKQLDPMTEKGEVLLDFSVYDARRAGFDRVVFIIKEENYALFRETVGARMEGEIEVRYAFQAPDRAIPGGCAVPAVRRAPGAKPLGTGHALLCAEEAVAGDCFAVINADDFYGADAFEKLASFLRESGQREAKPPVFAMAGYVLEKTLTDSGSVSRGICETDPDGRLRRISERTKIYRLPSGEVVYEENGKTTPTDPAGVVSMNCWAFTPAVFPLLKRGFAAFLQELAAAESAAGDPAAGGKNIEKAEFYLPVCVDEAMRREECAVRVLKTAADWYGVTYPDDKPQVKASLRALIDAGVYPDGLWGNGKV